MDKIDYQLKLWKTRGKLQFKGIHKPVDEMIKLGMIEKNKNNHNYLLGRIQDEEFLNKLITFNNAIE